MIICWIQSKNILTTNRPVKRISETDLSHVLSHTKEIWEPVRNKSIFITGSTGFFGKWLLETFLYINEKLGLNAKVFALSRNPDKFLEDFPFYKIDANISFIKGDILDFNFPSGNFDFIIHAATDTDIKFYLDNPLLMMDSIIKGTQRVLEFAKMQSLTSFLLTSSGAVYGKQPSTITNSKETEGFFIDINNPSSSYAEGKRVAELYCSTYFATYNLPIKIARCFAFVGPYLALDKHFAIGNFIRDKLQNKNIHLSGDGTPYRSYLYAADLAIWLWTILLKGNNNTPYNVGSDSSITISELAYKVANSENLSLNKSKVIIEKATKNPFPLRYVPNIDRAKIELGLNVYIDIEDALKRTIEFNKVTC